MNKEKFNDLSTVILNHCHSLLVEKAAHYANDADRLANFRKAAALACVPVPKAVAGMMVKHTVSIYDMIENVYGNDPVGKYSLDLWTEKIGDQINYLIILFTAIAEDLELEPKEGI